MTPSGRRRLFALAAVAVAAHLLALVLVLVFYGDPRPSGDSAAEGLSMAPLAFVELVDGEPPRSPPASSPAAGDRPGSGDGATASGVVDAPGPSGAGAGRRDGDRTWTPRPEQTTLRSRPWSHRRDFRVGQTGRRGDSSPEAIVRSNAPDLDGRPHRRPASKGSPEPRAGAPLAVPQRDWSDADPRLGSPSRRAGSADPAAVAQQAERGRRTVDASRRGPARTRASSSASNAMTVDPFDLSRSRGRGGRASGSGGDDGAGRRGSGTGAVREGNGGRGGWLRARRDNPYFRKLFAAVDGKVEYPRELALALQQGQVIVEFSLDGKGRANGLRVRRSSGQPALDSEVVTAIRAASPFGPPPRALLRGRAKLAVRMPYRFSSPMVR